MGRPKRYEYGKVQSSSKLKFDFNEAACLEVEYKPGKWARVTPNEFRSYNKPRRISYNEKYEEYCGPIYLFGTNIILKEPQTQGIQFVDNIDPRTQCSSKINGRV